MLIDAAVDRIAASSFLASRMADALIKAAPPVAGTMSWNTGPGARVLSVSGYLLSASAETDERTDR
jgi:hypothetical protein